MKKVLLSLIAFIVVAALIFGAGFIVSNKSKLSGDKSETIIQISQEILSDAARLETADYCCTYVTSFKNNKQFNDWNIPFTEKSFIASIDGTVSAGIADLTKAEISKRGENTIVVSLPKITVFDVNIDNDSFQKFDEDNNIFNPLSIDDFNNGEIEAKDAIKKRAIEKGIEEKAKRNAETIVTGMLETAVEGFNIKIEWQE